MKQKIITVTLHKQPPRRGLWAYVLTYIRMTIIVRACSLTAGSVDVAIRIAASRGGTVGSEIFLPFLALFLIYVGSQLKSWTKQILEVLMQ